MLEQEVASIIRYCMEKSGVESFYTDILPKDFIVPSVYFPTPEIDSKYDTLSSYNLHYVMPIRIFARDNQQAYKYALVIVNSLISEHNRIPMRSKDGSLNGAFFRVNNSNIKKIDTGVYGFNIEWDSVRTFDDIPDEI